MHVVTAVTRSGAHATAGCMCLQSSCILEFVCPPVPACAASTGGFAFFQLSCRQLWNCSLPNKSCTSEHPLDSTARITCVGSNSILLVLILPESAIAIVWMVEIAVHNPTTDFIPTLAAYHMPLLKLQISFTDLTPETSIGPTFSCLHWQGGQKGTWR